MSLNDYKSAHKFLKTKKRGTQKLFHGHYIHDHEGKDHWQFVIIDQCTTNAELRKREVYWQHRLKTFFPDGLNEVKNFVCNKLARQNIFCFFNAISSLVVLTYYYYYYY